MVILALPIVIGVVAYLAWRNRAVRGCRWRANVAGDKGKLRMYRCAACGAEAFTARKGPPEQCMRHLGNGGL
ncbi:hypothetical protein Z949_539 [Sulfitobacter guttiformis KCTC 32187]|uniref:Uncharacterized protein n=1 Tax=Sulfitobacter guttiformis TaxID=74349 RepID=A0A420DU62_9RHOB|nr:hypothetical protein Z949_539 [Sulfitobacter guttiformis KCTC 32187]RKE97826.1 hypothetical protein C8N30_2455 [Sulfitobacter guttiformis]